jgi:hypothetical protein
MGTARTAAALALAAIACLPLGQAGAAPYGPIAVARSPVRVQDGTVVLVLACHNARCEGVAKLLAQVGPPPPEREPGDEGRKVLIGSAPFAIPAETTKHVRIALNQHGQSIMRRAKRSGRYALLSGPGLRHRTLLLKRVP